MQGAALRDGFEQRRKLGGAELDDFAVRRSNPNHCAGIRQPASNVLECEVAGSALVDGHTLMAELLAAGEYDVASSTYLHRILQLKGDDAPVEWEGGPQPIIIRPNGIGIHRYADEPASALDPIATQRIEELIYDLKKAYTIVIVTHNMQQAARVSDVTAFFWLGKLVEFGATERIFTNPSEKLTEDYVTGRFG